MGSSRRQDEIWTFGGVEFFHKLFESCIECVEKKNESLLILQFNPFPRFRILQVSDWIIQLNSCFSKRKNYISKKSKGRIYRSISMKRKKTCRSLWSHGQSMMILRKKKKEKMYRRNLLNYLRLTFILSSPFRFTPWKSHGVFLLSSVRSKVPSPLTRSRNEEFLSIYP